MTSIITLLNRTSKSERYENYYHLRSIDDLNFTAGTDFNTRLNQNEDRPCYGVSIETNNTSKLPEKGACFNSLPPRFYGKA